MRALWSASLDSADQIPVPLHGLSFAGPDTVQYHDAVKGRDCIAHTLRGLLRRDFAATGDVLFEELTRHEVFFKWDRRGPLAFHTATHLALHDCPGAVGDASLIALCEYDVHTATAAYDGTTPMRWVDAMTARGYQSVFLLGPDARSVSGLGLAWRRDQFALCVASESIDQEEDGIPCGVHTSGVL